MFTFVQFFGGYVVSFFFIVLFCLAYPLFLRVVRWGPCSWELAVWGTLFIRRRRLVSILTTITRAEGLVLSTRLTLTLRPFVRRSQLYLCSLRILRNSVIRTLYLMVTISFLRLNVRRTNGLVRIL